MNGRILIALLMLMLPATGYTQSSSPSVMTVNGYAVVDQVIATPFSPSRVTLLVEHGIGKVGVYPATIVSYPGSSGIADSTEEVFAGGRIPLTIVNSLPEGMHFAFFVFGGSSSFAATPVKRWSRQMLADNTKSAVQLRDELDGIRRKINVQRLELSSLEEKLKVIRVKGFQLTGIDQIVALQTNLERVKKVFDDKREEGERLSVLVELGRQMEEPIGINERRHELLTELQQAAERTAMADRLSARKREAAVASMQQKIALINDMKTVDADGLAREILNLRGKRRALEAKLHVSSAEESNEF